jgi:DNA invertase Pin-like site-specific DNA recombinase
MTIYGYARVSTDGQSLASQESELKAAGCVKVFAEKASGARGDRVELSKALKRLDMATHSLSRAWIDWRVRHATCSISCTG